MPKTKFQQVIFALIMSLVMAFGMEHYNLALNNGGLNAHIFATAWKWTEVPRMTAIVFIMEFFIVGPVARRKAAKLVTPERDNPLFITLVTAGCTVMLMCPIMSCWATVLFKHPTAETFIPIYLQTLACNFPMALLWQIFFAGPLVRFVFRSIFREKESESIEEATVNM